MSAQRHSFDSDALFEWVRDRTILYRTKNRGISNTRFESSAEITFEIGSIGSNADWCYDRVLSLRRIPADFVGATRTRNQTQWVRDVSWCGSSYRWTSDFEKDVG